MGCWHMTYAGNVHLCSDLNDISQYLKNLMAVNVAPVSLGQSMYESILINKAFWHGFWVAGGLQPASQKPGLVILVCYEGF